MFSPIFPNDAVVRNIWLCLSDWDDICGTKWRLKCPVNIFPWEKKKKEKRKKKVENNKNAHHSMQPKRLPCSQSTGIFSWSLLSSADLFSAIYVEVEAMPGRQHNFGSRVLSSFLVDICGVSYEVMWTGLHANHTDVWVYLPSLMQMINELLTTGVFPSNFKTDPNNLKNYRLISNPSFLSKLLKKTLWKDHLKSNDLYSPFQSAYQTGHSMETALTHVTNDLVDGWRKDLCGYIVWPVGNLWHHWPWNPLSMTSVALWCG